MAEKINLEGPLKQTILGFGGALTDAALIAIDQLTEQTRMKIQEQWFKHFNLIRIPIGGSDFSSAAYALDSVEDDFELVHFNLSKFDFESRIPTLRRWKEQNKSLKIFGSAWSAPVWMKSNRAFNGYTKVAGSPGGAIHKAWALYYIKYIEHMASLGVPIWALTTQNEPSMGLYVSSDWNANGFTPRHMRDWLIKDFLPAIKSHSYAAPRPEIFILDDQRIFLPRFTDYLLENPIIRDSVQGVAIHWYWNQVSSPELLDDFNQKYPDKLIMSSEACLGNFSNKYPFQHVWHQGERYAEDIIESLNHFTNAWVDWNLALDMTGGPNWAGNMRNACIHVDSDKDEFYKAPCYYVLLHFSKFFTLGTRIIESSSPENVLLGLRENGEYVGVILNLTPFNATYSFLMGDNEFITTLSGHSISSFIWRQ